MHKTEVSNITHDIAMVGILVHGDNHFIVRGPLPNRESHSRSSGTGPHSGRSDNAALS